MTTYIDKLKRMGRDADYYWPEIVAVLEAASIERTMYPSESRWTPEQVRVAAALDALRAAVEGGE